VGQPGQVASYQELAQLVFEFERVLNRFDLPIQSGSELEGACCSVLDMLGNQQNTHDPQEDIRYVFTEILGIWTFLKRIIRLERHACFSQFVPHLALLNKGTVGQNKRAPLCQEATNKIFELLFALVLLDVSDEVILDHPASAKGDNPDILATIDGQCWGFACKTIYGESGKTFYDNLKKGVEQIEEAPKAEIGIVVINFRNIISHEECWPIMNETEYRRGAAPLFTAFEQPGAFVASHILAAVKRKCDQVIADIEIDNVKNLFAGKKAVPAFLAFCETCSGRESAQGPIPTSILKLDVGQFGDVKAQQGVFEKINLAVYERLQ
jgi:hypothetical protein